MKKNSIDIIGLSSKLNGQIRLNGFNTGISFLRNCGQTVKVFLSAKSNYGHKTSTIKTRIDDLHGAFSDKNINLITNLTGG